MLKRIKNVVLFLFGFGILSLLVCILGSVLHSRSLIIVGVYPLIVFMIIAILSSFILLTVIATIYIFFGKTKLKEFWRDDS